MAPVEIYNDGIWGSETHTKISGERTVEKLYLIAIFSATRTKMVVHKLL